MNRLNSTRFITQEELAKQLVSLDFSSNQYEVGGIPLLVKENKVYVDASDSHTMIYGATGSKKTRMFAMPSIGIFARGNESFVVTDPKGELYERTAGDVLSYGYDVKCMNLRNFNEGFCWNPLALPYEYYHSGKRAKAMEFITEMANMIIGSDSTEEAFWTNSSVDVFTGFILFLFEHTKKEECHLRSLVEIWNRYTKNRREILRYIRENYGDTIIYQKISSLDNAADKTVGSIEAFINMGLNRLSINEEFMDFLSHESINLEQLIEEKVAVYLVIPDENKSYHFVVSLFLEQLYEVLIHKAQGELQQKLPIRMNFLIDEFGNIPKIENMDAMITAARSRNIRFHLIVQGMKQLKQKYGDGAEVISGNCNNWIYLYSKEYELLQEISRLCGEVIYDNNIRMPLFSEFDLQHLSKEKGEALILSGRNCPCISNLADIEEYPFKQKEMPQRKQWENGQVKVLNLNEKRRNSYSYPIENFEMAQFCGIRMPEVSKWVVGTGPDGMILVEGIFKEKQIHSEYAFHKLLDEKGPKEYLKAEDLQWYSAGLPARKRYEQWLEEHPDIEYPTIEQLGKSAFTIRKRAEFKKQGQYSFRAEMWDEERMLLGDTIIESVAEDYGGMLGMWYAHNKFFMALHSVLKGTKYERTDWKFCTDAGESKKAVFFEKKIDERNFVVAYMCQE